MTQINDNIGSKYIINTNTVNVIFIYFINNITRLCKICIVYISQKSSLHVCSRPSCIDLMLKKINESF